MRFKFLLPVALSASLITAQAASAQQAAAGGGAPVAGTAATAATTEVVAGTGGLFGSGGLLGGGLFAGGLFGLGTGVTFGILAFTGILVGYAVSEATTDDQPNSP